MEVLRLFEPDGEDLMKDKDWAEIKAHLNAGDDVLLPSFFYWSRWRKIGVAAVCSLIMGALAGGATCIARDHMRRSAYEQRVEEYMSGYAGHGSPDRAIDNCLMPGGDARIFRSSKVNGGNRHDMHGAILTDGVRNALQEDEEDILCLRPVDGGQDVGVESEIKVYGIDYDSIVREPMRFAGLKLVHGVPDIFPSEFSVDSVSVNGEDVPLEYAREMAPDSRTPLPHHYIDIAKLVSDGILDEDDFDDGLEVRVRSSMGIGEVPPLDSVDVGRVSDYGCMPSDVRRFTEGADEFPSYHPFIRGIVSSYPGDADDVWGIMGYAIDYVNRSLEYHRPGNNTLPLHRLVDEGRGNCVDYSRLFVTLLRGFGIPARVSDNLHVVYASGQPDAGEYLGAHAWPEVFVPLSDGSFRWVIVENTWSDGAADPYSYINFRGSQHLYSLDLDVQIDMDRASSSYELFQEHVLTSSVKAAHPDPVSGVGEDDGGAPGADGSCPDCVRFMLLPGRDLDSDGEVDTIDFVMVD